jgi:multiple sugar transport system permease protein
MKNKSNILYYIILIVGSSFMVFPFLWMIATSLKTGVDIYNISLIPHPVKATSYKTVIENTEFILWFGNSLLVALITTASVLFFDTLVGYTFAKLDFKGKKVIFIIILSTLMVPTEMLIIPWYLAVTKLRLFDSHISLIFPGLSSAFGIFLMKQFFEAVPNDLLEAGRIDGLSEFGIFLKAAVPLVKPAISALGIFTFLGNWNAFLWPVIAVNSTKFYTLPVGLAQFSSESYNQWDLIMAGSCIATIPVLIIFLIFQKQIIEGIHMTGIKG